METRANYVAVGAFVLVFLVGIVVALLWFAGRQYQAGIFLLPDLFLRAGDRARDGAPSCAYNGIDVGRVTNLAFDPQDPKLVVVTLQVRSDVALHEDSAASIESQGLTGVAYVEIAGGTKGAPLLQAKDGQEYPVIPSKQSSLQRLFENTPQLVERFSVIADRLADFLSDDNRAALSETLANVARYHGRAEPPLRRYRGDDRERRRGDQDLGTRRCMTCMTCCTRPAMRPTSSTRRWLRWTKQPRTWCS